MRCTLCHVTFVLCVLSPTLHAQERTAPIKATLAIKKADRILSSSPVSLDAVMAEIIDGATELMKEKMENPAELSEPSEGMFTDQFTREDYKAVKKTIERAKRLVTSAKCFDRPVRASVVVDRASPSEDGTIQLEGSFRARRLSASFREQRQLSDEAIQYFENISVSVDISSDLADDINLHKLENARNVIITIQVSRFDIGATVLKEENQSRQWIITSVSGQATGVGRNVFK